jgi:hypothetical protein
MGTLSQDIEEKLFKGALGNKDSRPWATEQIERSKGFKTERAEKERTDTPKDNEGKLVPQNGLSKYEQTTGLKRRRGALIVMVANGEDLDHIEAAYEALGARKTISIELENSTITLNMATKEDRAKRGMVTQKENEIQDNINAITENRNQVPPCCSRLGPDLRWALSIASVAQASAILYFRHRIFSASNRGERCESITVGEERCERCESIAVVEGRDAKDVSQSPL